MSGEKYSKIQLEREQKARQEARADIGRVMCELQGLEARVKRAVDSMPQGVRESFPKEMEKVNSWQRELARAPVALDRMDSQQLRGVIEELKSISLHGAEALRVVTEVKESKREQRAREIMCEVELLKGNIEGVKEKVDLWEPGLVQDYLKEAETLMPMVEAGDFIKAQSGLKGLRARFEASKDDIFDREARHQQRLYVMDSLKEVCKMLGFGEVEAAHLENEADRGSPLIYKVDTYDEGLITFKLTLDGIEAESAIRSRVCMNEFDRLSENLSERFGVKTKFKVVTPLDDEPELKEQGELDLPDGGEEVELEHELDY